MSIRRTATTVGGNIRAQGMVDQDRPSSSCVQQRAEDLDIVGRQRRSVETTGTVPRSGGTVTPAIVCDGCAHRNWPGRSHATDPGQGEEHAESYIVRGCASG